MSRKETSDKFLRDYPVYERFLLTVIEFAMMEILANMCKLHMRRSRGKDMRCLLQQIRMK